MIYPFVTHLLPAYFQVCHTPFQRIFHSLPTPCNPFHPLVLLGIIAPETSTQKSIQLSLECLPLYGGTYGGIRSGHFSRSKNNQRIERIWTIFQGER